MARAEHWARHDAPVAIEGSGGDATAYRVACTLKDLGLSEFSAWSVLVDIWNERCKPPWTPEELETKARNAYLYGARPPGAESPEANFAGLDIAPPEPPGSVSRLQLHFFGDVGSDRPPEWLIKGWLPKDGVALLGGQSRVGKTFLALDLAGAAAMAGAFFGRPVRERIGVLFVLGEGAATMGARLEALRRVRFPDANPATVPIAWHEAGDARRLADLLDISRAEMQARYGVRLGLVVIDTLAAVFNVLDENDPNQATGVMQVLQRLARENGCLVIGVSHFGKNAEAGVRGSSAWTASADVVLAATAAISEATGKVKDRRLALTKSRYAETCPISAFQLEEIAIAVDDDLEPVTAAVVRSCEATTKRRAPSRHAQLLMDCVDEVLTSDPIVIGGRSSARRDRVRALFNARRSGSPDRGNRSRDFTAATKDAGFKIEIIRGEQYLQRELAGESPAVAL